MNSVDEIVTNICKETQNNILLRLSEIKESTPFISKDMDGYMELVKQGGKLVRPRLLIISYGLFNGNTPEKLININSSLELYHNNSLIFNDILDKAKLRRKKKAYHTKFGVNRTLTFLAFLSREATNLILSDNLINQRAKMDILNMFINTQKSISLGELHEIFLYKNQRMDVSESEYFEIITGKTASLFAYAFEVGAYLANPKIDKNIIENYRQIGLRVGMLFQILDDYIDLFSQSEKFGKPKYIDLRKGKKTLFYIYTRKHLKGEDKVIFEVLYQKEERTGNDCKKILEFIEKISCKDIIIKRLNEIKHDINNQLDQLMKQTQLNIFYMSYLKKYLQDLMNLYLSS